MKEKIINNILQRMQDKVNNKQLEELKIILIDEFSIKNTKNKEKSNDKLEKLFIDAKRLEGCSNKTILYYISTIEMMLNKINKNIIEIETEDLRTYLSDYQMNNNSSKVTIDNIRRILSSFFSWLEDENYIIKSPVRRIKKVKAPSIIKETYTDEELEIMRDNVGTVRDLALIDVLASTGMRVGELVKLNIEDVNFTERECIALFISLKAPYGRLSIGGVELRLRKIGKQLGIKKVHPHKFRRTLATIAIDKGMPIEQVQKLLGHEKIDTTLQYAMVKQSNVKIAHQKYIG